MKKTPFWKKTDDLGYRNPKYDNFIIRMKIILLLVVFACVLLLIFLF